jgi:urease accessory protein
MGSPATRITSENFLTPAEFQGLKLAEKSSGQIGGARFTLIESDGATRIGPCYQQVPLRVAPPFRFPGEPAILVYLINPTAGLMDGDGHLIEIDASPGTSAVVTGQSATRIHPSLSSFSTQRWNVKLGPKARLVALPGPNMPFRGCRYYQTARFDLADDSHLIWGDVWTPGRYARDELSEIFQFERIVQELEVRRNGQLVFRDRFDWKGPWDEETARWYVGSHRTGSMASLFVTGTVDIQPSEPGAPIHRSVLKLAHGDTLIRWCGPTPEVITEVATTALTLPARPNFGGLVGERPWLVGANHLVPNHWFSPSQPLSDSPTAGV